MRIYIILWLHLPDRFHSSDESICLMASSSCSLLAGRATAIVRIEHASRHLDERVHGFVDCFCFSFVRFSANRYEIATRCDGHDERSHERICTRSTILFQLAMLSATANAENSNKCDSYARPFQRNQQLCRRPNIHIGDGGV